MVAVSACFANPGGIGTVGSGHPRPAIKRPIEA